MLPGSIRSTTMVTRSENPSSTGDELDLQELCEATVVPSKIIDDVLCGFGELRFDDVCSQEISKAQPWQQRPETPSNTGDELDLQELCEATAAPNEIIDGVVCGFSKARHDDALLPENIGSITTAKSARASSSMGND